MFYMAAIFFETVHHVTVMLLATIVVTWFGRSVESIFSLDKGYRVLLSPIGAAPNAR